jgi:hypothetical protein
MTRSPSTPTPHTGDENPGGMIRQGQGRGLGGFAIIPTGTVRRGGMKSQQSTHTMGETGWSVGRAANHKAGGPFSRDLASNSVIVGGALRGAEFVAQAGGPVGASAHGFYVAFNEVVFCSERLPGGTVR